MADTIEVVRLTGDDWHDVSVLTSIAVGTAMYIQSQSSTPIQMAVSATKPSKTFKGMILPNDLRYPATVTVGENNVWLYGIGPVSIQEA
jgi:hypothetical protein